MINDVEIIEGDMVLVTNDRESQWWAVNEIDIGEEWIPTAVPEHPSVRHYPVFWCSNKEGDMRSFTSRDFDRHEPTGRR